MQAQTLYAAGLDAGIRIFEYEKSFMHAKVAVIDGEWATVGSSNIDPFSLLLAKEVLKYLRRYPVRGGVAHAFNGSPQQAAMFIERGFCLGFGGAATFEGSLRIRQLVATLPATATVLETDAPDISPAWLHGARNSPVELPRIAAVVAELRGVPLLDLVAQTRANAHRVLPALE